MPTGKDSSKNDMEKLLSIEAEVKIMADQLDKDKALFEKEKKAEEAVASFNQRMDKLDERRIFNDGIKSFCQSNIIKKLLTT